MRSHGIGGCSGSDNRRESISVDINEDMIIEFFGKFVEIMQTNGDGLCEEVGKALNYDERIVPTIRRKIQDRRWIRWLASDVDTITRTGLREAREYKLISDQEYQRKKQEIFDR